MATEGLDVSVILPTYREAENLPLVVPGICRALADAGLRGEVIVVDDDSPDGTGAVAGELAQNCPVRVKVRTGQRGLATAAIAGFGLSGATVCAVMDADGSHAPECLPQLVRPVLSGSADIAIGSRYVKGGSTPAWPWRRRLISRSAGWLARGLVRLRDPTSGYMAVRRDLLSGLELAPVGFKIVLEVAVRARGARIVEVPIAFRDRELGASKMSLVQTWRYLRHLGRLYRFRYLTRSRA